MVTSHVHVARWWILRSKHNHEQFFLFEEKRGEKSQICICCLEHIHTNRHSFMGMCHWQLACTMCHFSSVSQPLSGTLSLHFLRLQTPILSISEPRTGTRLDATGAYPKAYNMSVKFYTRSYVSCKHWCEAIHFKSMKEGQMYIQMYSGIQLRMCKYSERTNIKCNFISASKGARKKKKKPFKEIHTVFFPPASGRHLSPALINLYNRVALQWRSKVMLEWDVDSAVPGDASWCSAHLAVYHCKTTGK